MNLEELFIRLGYTRLDYKQIVENYSLRHFKYETFYKNIVLNYQFLLDVGYTKEEIIKITKLSPKIYSYSVDNLKQKIEDIINLGYSKKEVLKITNSLPNIYSYSIDNMKQKFEGIINFGYTKEQVLKMTISLPTIFGYTLQSMKQKLEFYDFINIHEMPILSPKFLMQSVALSYARYMFLATKGIDISMSNYRMLFYGNKQFEKQHNVTKQHLLKLYNFEDYERERVNERVI